MTLQEAKKLNFPCELVRTNYPFRDYKEGDKIITLRINDTAIMDNKGLWHHIINVELPEAKEADNFETWWKKEPRFNFNDSIKDIINKGYIAGQSSSKPRQYAPSELYMDLKAHQALEGISDKDLAEQIGLSVPTINRLKTNSPEIRLSTYIQVVNFLKL